MVRTRLPLWRGVALPIALALLAANAPAERTDADPEGQVYGDDVPPMDVTVSSRLRPQVDALLEQLLREKRAMRLGGVEVFKSGDKFLPGKIAYAMAQRVLTLPPGDARLPGRLNEFAQIADLTLDDANETWGIYYYVAALHDLAKRDLLTRALRPATLARLKAQLDWRSFVRPDLSLINLPNNYYGVAFSVARLRHLLGWEDGTAADQLLARTLDHYRKYSGEFGFADETVGKGRFDRYSVLLIGEIAQRLIETGVTPPPEVRAWLRKSVDLLMLRFNRTGQGFEYGRSLGPYGETVFLEVLTAAALLKILTPTEERMAYAFSSRIAARYMDFWVDPATGSVDMWAHGRRTDDYRGIHRIFGENLSLARQYAYTNAIWNQLGYRGQATDPGYAKWLRTLPRATLTWFARGQNDRAVATIRDGDRVIGLPLINGAEGQHMHTPYFPVPFSPGMLAGSADATYPHLVPQITLADGAVLMPLAYFRDVRLVRRGNRTELSWRQDMLDRMGADDARADRRATIETRYTFTPGRIQRRDTLHLASDAPATRIDMEFATFSAQPSTQQGRIDFGDGTVRRFAAASYGDCAASVPQAPQYRSPYAPFSTVVRCTRAVRDGERTISLRWEIDYAVFPIAEQLVRDCDVHLRPSVRIGEADLLQRLAEQFSKARCELGA